MTSTRTTLSLKSLPKKEERVLLQSLVEGLHQSYCPSLAIQQQIVNRKVVQNAILTHYGHIPCGFASIPLNIVASCFMHQLSITRRLKTQLC